jgi:hypothetical protein
LTGLLESEPRICFFRLFSHSITNIVLLRLNGNSPTDKSPNDKSPNDKSPNTNSPNDKSTTDKSPKCQIAQRQVAQYGNSPNTSTRPLGEFQQARRPVPRRPPLKRAEKRRRGTGRLACWNSPVRARTQQRA